MGYTTEFKGHFNLDKPLTREQAAYLRKFSNTRRMRRSAGAAEQLPDPTREAVGLPIGLEGEYFVGGGGLMGQEHDASIAEYNDPPRSQPGLWCHWTVTEDGQGIEWDGGEKFYCYTEWLEYLIAAFLKPWGLSLNGKVNWQGEEIGDIGTITVKDNIVSVGAYMGRDVAREDLERAVVALGGTVIWPDAQGGGG